MHMHQQRGASSDERAALTPAHEELVEARDSCRRMSHTIDALKDTIVVLRAGANSLAIDNAILRIENERLRVTEQAGSSKRG